MSHSLHTNCIIGIFFIFFVFFKSACAVDLNIVENIKFDEVLEKASVPDSSRVVWVAAHWADLGPILNNVFSELAKSLHASIDIETNFREPEISFIFNNDSEIWDGEWTVFLTGLNSWDYRIGFYAAMSYKNVVLCSTIGIGYSLGNSPLPLMKYNPSALSKLTEANQEYINLSNMIIAGNWICRKVSLSLDNSESIIGNDIHNYQNNPDRVRLIIDNSLRYTLVGPFDGFNNEISSGNLILKALPDGSLFLSMDEEQDYLVKDTVKLKDLKFLQTAGLYDLYLYWGKSVFYFKRQNLIKPKYETNSYDNLKRERLFSITLN